MAQRLKPGHKAPVSGQYEIVGPRGGKTGREVTVIKGEPLPPSKKSGQAYVVLKEGEARTLRRSIDPSQVDREKIRSIVRAVHVLPAKDGKWEVKGKSVKEHIFTQKDQALSYARDLIKGESKIIVHNRSGAKTTVKWYD
ncbi:MAG: hypothetical protein ACI8V2_001002 [Candidatus Latescibacterota bacterium]|jgi:hypothetical protein